MSKLAEKLQSLSKSSVAPIGFRPSVSDLKSPAMVLVGALSGPQLRELKTMVEAGVDALLVPGDGSHVESLKPVIESSADIPVGVLLKSLDDERISELTALGCDFAVFDISLPATILHKERIGKFLLIEPSLDQGLVRGINSLEVDGVFVSGTPDSHIAVEHVLACRRLVELLEKPVIAYLPSSVTKAELTSLWQAGVDGAVTAPAASGETLAELKKMIADLPKRGRGGRTRPGVALPQYGGPLAWEEEREDEET